MHRRFIEGDFKRRFVCLTFEDGYKDFLRWAYPVLRKYKLPFAMYIATSFPDRLGELWWVALEAVIAQNSRIGMVINGKDQYFECATSGRSASSMMTVYRYLRSMKTEEEVRRVVRDLCACYQRRRRRVLPRPVHGLGGDCRCLRPIRFARSVRTPSTI